MKMTNFIKYYCVFKNATTVTEVSVNDFKPVPHIQYKGGVPVTAPSDEYTTPMYFSYSLPADDDMFYGYISKARAMEQAKSGALLYIDSMIEDVEQGIKKLKAYRAKNYNELNVTLLDASIRKLEKEMNIK